MNNIIFDLVIVCRNIEVNWDQFSNPIYIGVESGALKLIEHQFTSAFFCGDFDSVTKTEMEKIQIYSKTHNISLIKSESQKDMIDAEIAIMIAENKLLSFDKVFIISSGKRWDMVLAQINLIRKYEQYHVALIDEFNYIFTIKSGTEFIFTEQLMNYNYISFFPLTSQSTTYQFFGCKYYPGKKITIDQFNVLAISNEFTRQNGELPKIKVFDNDCMVILTKNEKTIQ